MHKKIFNKKVSGFLKKRKPFFEKSLFKEKIFSWEEMEKLINCRPFMNSTRVRIPKEYSYQWPFQQWLSDINTFPAKTVKEMLDKHWFYIMDCSRVNEKVNHVCKNLEEITKNPADAHIFISTKTNKNKEYNNKSFGKHNDEQDNLIVLIEGSIKMELYDQKNPDKIFIEKTLEPGDAVFVPKGMFHKVTGLSKRLSISFPMSLNSSPDPFQDRDWVKL